jgi:myosin heavy subunit
LQLYQSEEIAIEKIQYKDNSETLSLIEGKKPQGLLPMLDEEIRMPNGSDKSLILKYHQTFGNNKHKQYEVIKKNPNAFMIFHFAGNGKFSNFQSFILIYSILLSFSSSVSNQFSLLVSFVFSDL